MKAILAAILSAFLCVETVFAMPAREPVYYTDTQTEADDGSQAAGETEAQTEDTQENAADDQSVETGENAGDAAAVEISAPSAILMEASTGKVVYEKNPDEKLPPASVTKIMTLLLIFDAIDEGKITLEDQVTTSDYAASMGGSQVFLEPGESQTVDTMMKCIAVASANDACVAMAEYLWGSEEEFVAHMNERAKGLGMENTTFMNCNGLDTDGHLTTARDIGLMSRELITKYPKIRDYSMIWMEDITHTTKKGTTTFGLSNTNKLIRQYEYATGLKTGSTDKAKYCVSATAEKNNMELIAVIMAAPDHKVRFQDATTLLNYGFGKCMKYTDEGIGAIDPLPVTRGVAKKVRVKQAAPFDYIDTTGADLSSIKKKYITKGDIKAPVKTGDKVGEIAYYIGDSQIGTSDIIATEDVPQITYKSALQNALGYFLL